MIINHDSSLRHCCGNRSSCPAVHAMSVGGGMRGAASHAYEDEPVAAVAGQHRHNRCAGLCRRPGSVLFESYCAPVVVGVRVRNGVTRGATILVYGTTMVDGIGRGMDGDTIIRLLIWKQSSLLRIIWCERRPRLCNEDIRSGKGPGEPSGVCADLWCCISSGDDGKRNVHFARKRGGRCPHEEWCSDGHSR